MSHVRYMDRIREYYINQGYEKPYIWAQYDDVPFTPLKKPLAESAVTLLSTSDVSIKRADGTVAEEEQTVGNVYSVPWKTPHDQLYSRQESFDRHATSLDDIEAYLPLRRMEECVAAGRIGAVTPHFHNVNRGYSKRLMIETAAPAALEACRADGADVAILTPV